MSPVTAVPATGLRPLGRVAAPQTSTASPSAVPQVPYADRYTPGFGLKLANLGRTLKLAATELYGGHTISSEGLHKPWQKALHDVFPGGLVLASFSTFQPDPAGDGIPSGPITRSVDPRAFMPNVHFEKGENAYPVDPNFDGDGDVTNNSQAYRTAKLDGSQEPTIFVNARQKGEYTVLQYWCYYADDRYLNYHKHDWEGFSVYLAPDAKGALQPAFLQTNWHQTHQLTAWNDLAKGTNGRPTVLVDRGSHGARPLRPGDPLPKGATVTAPGTWTENGRMSSVNVHLRGDDPNLIGMEPVKPLAGGIDPRDAYYPGKDWILGFLHVGEYGVGPGPRSRQEWSDPYHPAAFGRSGGVSGLVALPAPMRTAAGLRPLHR